MGNERLNRKTDICSSHVAAKQALRRKKANEHTLEQTMAQIGTLETQINAIESANINHETLLAMQQAGKAMANIHGKLTPEKVDQTMWVHAFSLFRLARCEVGGLLYADTDR
jgi:charged multivesicular body protein 4